MEIYTILWYIQYICVYYGMHISIACLHQSRIKLIEFQGDLGVDDHNVPVVEAHRARPVGKDHNMSLVLGAG